MLDSIIVLVYWTRWNSQINLETEVMTDYYASINTNESICNEISTLHFFVFRIL